MLPRANVEPIGGGHQQINSSLFFPQQAITHTTCMWAVIVHRPFLKTVLDTN